MWTSDCADISMSRPLSTVGVTFQCADAEASQYE